MRLSTPIETLGTFWLPANPEDRLSGNLRISDSGKVTLELGGIFGDERFAIQDMGIGTEPPPDGDKPDYSRIVGEVEQGGFVTLERCLPAGSRIKMAGGQSKSTYQARFAFIGGAYDPGKELSFADVSLSVKGLNEWLSVSGIHLQWDLERKSGSICYHCLEDISFRLQNETDITFSFSITPPGFSRFTTEASVVQESNIVFKPNCPQPIEYFSSLALKLCNFLSLAIDQPVSTISMTGFLERETESPESPRSPIHIFYEASSRSDASPEIRWYDIIFTYQHVANQCEEILTKWLESYETFEPAFNLYFSSRSDPFQYLDGRFLRLVQGLETLHRRSCQDTVMPKGEFKKLLDSLLENCPKEWEDLVRGNLNHANAPSLRKRMASLIEPFQEFFGSQDEATSFVSQVVHTRNYFTHYNQSLERKAANREDLWRLCEKLDALFILHLLRLIGFDPNLALNGVVVEGYSRLANKLKS